MSSSRTTEESTNTLETKSCNVTLTDLDEADQLQYEDQIQDREDQNQDADYEQDQEQVRHLKITNFLLNIFPALQGLWLCFVFLNLSLTERNIQVKFGLKRVLES